MPTTEPERELSKGQAPTWSPKAESSNAPETRPREASQPPASAGARTRFSPPPPPYAVETANRGKLPGEPSVPGESTRPGSSPGFGSPSVSQSPSVRVPLSSAGQHLGGVRIAIVDTDATRLDALASALRARRAEVHISSLRPKKSHFRLLRRFCPHALLIDEEVLALEGADFLRAFRADPFLSHVQLIAVRFERLFRERSGTASIESIKVLLEPLGRPETYLVSRLGPRCEIEFDFDQIPPHLLLKILSSRAAPTRIECTRGKETLTWMLVRGRTGSATLRAGASLEKRRLSSDAALNWLLEHKNCHVVLTQPDEFEELTSASEVIPKLEEKMSGLWELSRFAVEEPPPGTQPSIAPAPSFVPGAPDSARPSDATFIRSVAPKLPTERGWLRNPRVLGGVGALAATLVGTIFAVNHFDAPSREASSVSVQSAARSEDTNPVQAGASNEVPVPAAVKPLDLDAEDEHSSVASSSLEAAFFRVKERPIEPCEVDVPEREQSEPSRTRMGDVYWRKGQRLLVAGRNVDARKELCKSAFLAPAGGGAEQLAELNLAARAPAFAELGIRKVLEDHPESRTARELLGDILHQQGKIEEAKSEWFRAFQVDASDERTKRGLARLWLRQAKESFRASDEVRAERYLRRSVTLDPTSNEARALLHKVFLRAGEHELAAHFAPR